MSSRGCYKSYGRKLNGPAGHNSIQFDKLYSENTLKPTASKSTGTVGKWGITSFTSIRSSKFTFGLNSVKRSKDKKDSYGTAAITPPPESPVAPKPKKFFKSRVTADTVPAKPTKSFQSTKSYQSAKSPRTPHSPSSPPPPRSYSKQEIKPVTNRPVRQASLAAAKKLADIPDNDFEEEYDEDIYAAQAMNMTRETVVIHSVEAHPPTPPEPEAKEDDVEEETTEEAAPESPPHPPIVLRIFKGTAQLVGADSGEENEKEKIHEKEKHDKHGKRESRRRSHGSDSGDGVSPKRHKSRHKSIEKPPTPPPPVKDSTEELTEAADETDPVEQSLQNQMSEVATDLSNKPAEAVKQTSVTEDDRVKLLRVLEDDDNPPEEPVKAESAGELKEEHVEEDPEAHAKDGPGEPDCNEWATSNYVPPPEAKKEEAGSSRKVEPIVLRRPSTGGITKPPKKGSIFKSRGGEKRNARYIHNWSDQKEEAAQKPKNPAPAASAFDETDFDNDVLTRITLRDGQKQSEEDASVTSVTCSKKAKDYYTVVRNVKKVHQLQESGEFQEFNDDVEYILDALKDNNPISTRCLSAITLASKCMSPEFRMHVRAHGTVTKFFRALHDATKDQRLGMCTATVMFVLSQDRLNMDIDRDSLELMLNLLESDASHSSALEGCGLSDAELAKTKDRVRSLCQEIQEQGHARHLNLDNITVGQLAMETLLSLTCKRAGEWFKEELRDLGGLEHIIKTVVETCRPVETSVMEWTPQLLDRLKKADRCLKVLENVSPSSLAVVDGLASAFDVKTLSSGLVRLVLPGDDVLSSKQVTLQNEENNNYLWTYGDGILVDTVVRVFQVCDLQLIYYPTLNPKDKESTGAVIRECLIANLKVLINLTHDYGNKSFGSTLAGKKEGVIETSLHILLEIPNFVPEEQKFDVTVLALILLINLVEHSESNRKLLISSKAPFRCNPMFAEATAVSALVGMFLQQEELARTEERKTDAILDGEEKPPATQEQKKSNEDNMEETVQLLLQKAGRHMEHTLVGAYIALLLGYLIIDNEEYEIFVRGHMPNKNYQMLLSVLQKFYNFMTLTAAMEVHECYGEKPANSCAQSVMRVLNRIADCEMRLKNRIVKEINFQVTLSFRTRPQCIEEYADSVLNGYNLGMFVKLLARMCWPDSSISSAGAGSSRGIKATERLIKQLTEIDQAISGGEAMHQTKPGPT